MCVQLRLSEQSCLLFLALLRALLLELQRAPQARPVFKDHTGAKAEPRV